MLRYCQAVGCFHYKMEKERWMFFYIIFFDCGICRTVPQTVSSTWVTNCTHEIFYDLLLTYTLLCLGSFQCI